MQALLVKLLTGLLINFGHKLIGLMVDFIKEKLDTKKIKDHLRNAIKNPNRREAARDINNIING